jgi:NitT/TauT family transport system permease protein
MPADEKGTTLRPDEEETLAALEADVGRGLDALDTPTQRTVPLWKRLLTGVVPPVVAVALFLVLWQVLWASAIWPEFKLPAPGAVFGQIGQQFADGQALSIIWTSVSRAVFGFLIAVVIATPIGLLVATVPVVRAAIGPILTGLQSLPSVAWVPAAIIWFSLSNAAIYTVVLLGAVPSIANGLLSGLKQVPPLFDRVGRVLGLSTLGRIRYVLLPAALPGYLGGLRQGWAFAWRSLMAAELITYSPSLGQGLGQLLNIGRELSQMSLVITSITLILAVGVAIELLVFAPLERRVLTRRGLTAGR